MLIVVDCGLSHIKDEQIRKSMWEKGTNEEKRMLEVMEFGCILRYVTSRPWK